MKVKESLKKIMRIKLNALVLLMAGTLVLFAAGKNTDGIWIFSSGDKISASQINENFTALMNRVKALETNNQQLLASVVPPKTIIAYYGTICPTGWVPANGYAPSLNEGVQTPDLRGVFIRGMDNMGAPTGRDPGFNVDRDINYNGANGQLGSYQADAFQGHFHDYIRDGGGTGWGPDNVPANLSAGVIGIKVIGKPSADDQGNGDPRTASETRPKNVALLYCMKK